MALKVITDILIQPGESLSSGADCSAGEIVRLTMPPEWTPANLSFQISSDGEFYNNLVDTNGQEIVMPVVPGSAVIVAQFADYLRAIAFLKFRSGTSVDPVPQAALRDFAIAIEVPDAP